MNLIITCPRNFEEETAEEIFNLLSKLGFKKPEISQTKYPGILIAVIEDPLIVNNKIRETVIEEPWSIRYSQRLIPIQIGVKSHIDEIVEGVEKLKSVMNESDTYRITIEKRDSKLSSKELITRIATNIENKVNLENYDWLILVEIIGDLAGVSLLRQDDVLSIEKLKRGLSE